MDEQATRDQRFRDGTGPPWSRYVDHPFVRGLADGTLPHDAFRRSLTQAYLFMIHLVRAYALTGYKSTRLEDLHAAAADMTALSAEMSCSSPIAENGEWTTVRWRASWRRSRPSPTRG